MTQTEITAKIAREEKLEASALKRYSRKTDRQLRSELRRLRTHHDKSGIGTRIALGVVEHLLFERFDRQQRTS